MAGAPSVKESVLLDRVANRPFTLEELEEGVEATTYNHLIWSRSRTDYKHLWFKGEKKKQLKAVGRKFFQVNEVIQSVHKK